MLDVVDLSFFKVLAAEDNLVNQYVLHKMLEKAKVPHKIVDSGIQALEALQNEHFDLVLLDCNMLGMDGFETAACIRTAVSTFQKIPIIALTAAVLPSDKDKCLDVGMNDFLSKPITFEDLTQKLTQWGQKILNALPSLDSVRLSKIESFDDENHSLIRSLYEIYSGSTSDEVLQMKDLITSNQMELVRKKAHKLKSSAAQLGALRVEKFCTLLEYEEDLDQERAEKLYDQIIFEFNSSKILLEKICLSYGQI